MALTAPLERTSFSVHRCRFVDWNPSEITAIAFSPLPPPSSRASISSTNPAPQYGVLAVGRGNGCIELCEWARPESDGVSSQGWTVRRVLPGPNSSKVDSLAFSLRDPFSHSNGSAPGLSHLRLFSTAGGKDLLEWDPTSGTIKRVIDSDAGAIWSIAVNPTFTVLALGCDDGSVRLLSLADGDVTPLRRLDRVKTRILSLSWGPPRFIARPPRESDTSDSDDDDEESRWKDTYLVAGCADSSIRKWDLASGRVLERLTTDQVRGEKTLVWSVQLLLDGTIVTGDSLGCVKFWDPLTNTQMHSFQAHDADVLCLTVGSDHRSVYASGVDQRVSEFALVPIGGKNAELTQYQWIHTSSRRLHVHDVRCIAIWPPAQLFAKRFFRYSARDRIAPVLATGGQDMSLTLTAITPSSRAGSVALNPFARGQAPQIEDAFYHKMPYAQLGASGGRIVQCAMKARFISCRHDTKLSVWRVLPQVPRSLDGPLPENTGWNKLLEMDLKTDTTLVSSAISTDGQWLAVSDAYETKLFRLLDETAHGYSQVRPKRVKSLTRNLQVHLESASPGVSSDQLTGATAMQFTADSRKLVLAISGFVVVLDLTQTPEPENSRQTYDSRVVRSFAQHRRQGAARSRNGRVIKPLPERTAADISGSNVPDIGGEDASDVGDDGGNDSEESASDDASSYVSQVAVSADGQWLATSDLHGRTHVFNLDVVKHHCTLPTSPLPASALAFDPRPASQHILVLAFPDNSIQVFDVESREFPAWARAVNEQLPYPLSRLQDPIAGIAFILDDITDSIEASSARGSRRSISLASDRRNSRNVILWARGWLCKVDLMGDAALNLSGPTLGGIRKRKQPFGPPSDTSKDRTLAAQAGAEKDFFDQRQAQVVTRYRDIMLVDFFGPKEMIIVERPAVDILQNLRPAFYKPKYGSK